MPKPMVKNNKAGRCFFRKSSIKASERMTIAKYCRIALNWLLKAVENVTKINPPISLIHRFFHEDIQKGDENER